MQTRKEPVKNRIVKAALEEFLLAGYANSSMRNIATQSGITVGNIYSYFSSKEELFDYILSDTVDELNKLFAMKVEYSESLSTESLTSMARLVSDVFLKYRIQFLILMDGSDGSKYQDLKSTMIKQACERILSDAKLQGNSGTAQADHLLAESLSLALIEGMIHIFKHSGRNRKRLEALVGDFLAVIIKGFY